MSSAGCDFFDLNRPVPVKWTSTEKNKKVGNYAKRRFKIQETNKLNSTQNDAVAKKSGI